MATDFEIRIDDRPGALAQIGEATGGEGVNLLAVVGMVTDGQAVVHVVAEDAGATRLALAGAGLEVRAEREVLLTECPDRPGELAAVARRLAEAGVNLDLACLSTDGRLVLGAEDLAAARGAL